MWLASIGHQSPLDPPSVITGSLGWFYCLETRSAMVWEMACHLIDATPLPVSMLIYRQCNRNKLQWNLNQNTNNLTKNKYENFVCKMAQILLKSQNVIIGTIGYRRLADQERSGFNTLRPRQNGRHFADDIFKCIFLNENVWIPIKFSLKFVPKGPINNIPSLVQIMVWRRPGAKPLSEPMMVSLLTHICVTRPQWVK